MTDDELLEDKRRELVKEINETKRSREELEREFGKVWDTIELQEDFVIEGFLAPFISVTEKSTGQRGSLMFQHNPRIYFNLQMDKPIPDELTVFKLTAVNSRGEVEDILKR